MICKALNKQFPKWSFIGFYDTKEGDADTIYIGQYVTENIFPCGEIALGKGQCGLCAATKQTQILEDVSKAENYIACDSETMSEIVVPCFGKDNKLKTVLDIDSPSIATFDQIDKKCLEEIVNMIYDGDSLKAFKN